MGGVNPPTGTCCCVGGLTPRVFVCVLLLRVALYLLTQSSLDRCCPPQITMYQVKGRGSNLMLTQVEVSRSAMNSGDVFILDTLETIYQVRAPPFS